MGIFTYCISHPPVPALAVKYLPTHHCPLLYDSIFSLLPPATCLNIMQKSPFLFSSGSQNICIWRYKMLGSRWCHLSKPSSPVCTVVITCSFSARVGLAEDTHTHTPSHTLARGIILASSCCWCPPLHSPGLGLLNCQLILCGAVVLIS